MSFDDAVSQLLSEESCLQEMKGGGDRSAYAVNNWGAPTANQIAPPNSRTCDTKKSLVRYKDNLRCSYCKWKGHTKETCWKLRGQPLQVHMVAQRYLSREGADGQLWMQNHIPPTFNTQIPGSGINHQVQMTPQDVQRLQEEIQQMKNPLQQIQGLRYSASGSVIGCTSLANSGRSNIRLFLSSLPLSNSRESSWIYSGATDHMTPKSDILVSYEPCCTDKRVQLPME